MKLNNLKALKENAWPKPQKASVKPANLKTYQVGKANGKCTAS